MAKCKDSVGIFNSDLSTKMSKARYLEFDFLRTLVIVRAFILHFDSQAGLGFLAIPSKVAQEYVFTVGGFFFFTAGYMANCVYLPRFRTGSLQTSLHIVKKGLQTLLLYAAYVTFMHLSTDTPFPATLKDLIFGHRFYTKVLFSFGLVYLVVPSILLLTAKTGRWVTALLSIVTSVVFLAYSPAWRIPEGIRMAIFDRSVFLYPMLSSIITFLFGFSIFSLDDILSKKHDKKILAIFSVGVVLFHFGFLVIPGYRCFVRNRTAFTLVESVSPYLSILIARYILSEDRVKRFLQNPSVLCVGIDSLFSYAVSSMLLGFVTVPHNCSELKRIVVFSGIAFLSYLFTYWHFRSASPRRLTTGRCARL